MNVGVVNGSGAMATLTIILQEMTQLRMELSKQKKQIRRMQNENNPGPVAAALAKTTKPLTSKN